jgi:hypothetical protein
MNRGVTRRLSHVFMAMENNREQSTVLLGDVSSVRMKLIQAEIQRTRERIRETRDQFENQTTGRVSQDTRR